MATRRTKKLPQSVLDMYKDSLSVYDAQDYVDENVTMPPMITDADKKPDGKESKDSSQTTSNKHQ